MHHVFLLLVFSLSATALSASTTRGIHNDIPAARWEDAFLSGNGKSGIMNYGNPLNDTIIFNNHNFIRPKSLPGIPDMTPALEATRDQMISGDIHGGWNHYYTYMKNNGPDRWKSGGILESSQVFHPGYNMKIKINPEDPKTSGMVNAVKLALSKRNPPENQPQAHGNLMLMYCEARTKQADKFDDRLLDLMTNKHFPSKWQWDIPDHICDCWSPGDFEINVEPDSVGGSVTDLSASEINHGKLYLTPLQPRPAGLHQSGPG